MDSKFLVYLGFFCVCGASTALSLAILAAAYRLKSAAVGLKTFGSEFGVLLAAAGAQALLLFVVWRVMRWNHFTIYIIASGLGALIYKMTHLEEMDEYQWFFVGVAQFVFVWPALFLLGPLFGLPTRAWFTRPTF